MKFNQLAQKYSSDIDKMVELPFNQALAKGILDQEQFCYYMQQDALYLLDFSKALALTGTRLSQTTHISHFYQFAQNALTAERGLHQNYLGKFKVSLICDPNNACKQYTQFLMYHAHFSEPVVAIAALIPCFWVYQVVGQRIYQKAVKRNPYQAWIDMYASDDFEHAVKQIVDIYDWHCQRANKQTLLDVQYAFKNAMSFEHMFWVQAYENDPKLEVVTAC